MIPCIVIYSPVSPSMSAITNGVMSDFSIPVNTRMLMIPVSITTSNFLLMNFAICSLRDEIKFCLVFVKIVFVY